MKFRFSIRDVLWLILVVALALGWWIDHKQLRAEADRENQRATKWRGAAGALEDIMRDEGWVVKWDFRGAGWVGASFESKEPGKPTRRGWPLAGPGRGNFSNYEPSTNEK